MMPRLRASWLQFVALFLFLPSFAHAQAGSLDPTFSGDGMLRFEFDFEDARPSAMTIASDGKVVVAGTKWRGMGRTSAGRRPPPAFISRACGWGTTSTRPRR
jgi:hypothetical protein